MRRDTYIPYAHTVIFATGVLYLRTVSELSLSAPAFYILVGIRRVIVR